MSGHTPGPWRLDSDEKVGDWQVLDVAAVYVVADMPSDHVSKCTMADARLIAAAPDLLAACEAAQARLEAEGFRVDDDVPEVTDDFALERRLRAAIAKARGGRRSCSSGR